MIRNIFIQRCVPVVISSVIIVGKLNNRKAYSHTCMWKFNGFVWPKKNADCCKQTNNNNKNATLFFMFSYMKSFFLLYFHVRVFIALLFFVIVVFVFFFPFVFLVVFFLFCFFAFFVFVPSGIHCCVSSPTVQSKRLCYLASFDKLYVSHLVNFSIILHTK